MLCWIIRRGGELKNKNIPPSSLCVTPDSNMNILLQYDLLRLKAYQNNISVRNSIAINHIGELTLLKFIPINYFNYCIGKINSTEVLDYVKNFYSDISENKHRILIDSMDYLSREIIQLSSDYRLEEKISIMTLLSKDFNGHIIDPEMELVPVSEQNIKEFAWLYLACFEAENRHKQSVEENFRLKLNIDGLQLYFIYYNHKPIGITGLYFHPQFTILSFGAVLKEYRFLGLHKSALSWRIQRSKEMQGSKPIFSWAYKDSISYQNMLKIGMTVSQDLLAFQYVG